MKNKIKFLGIILFLIVINTNCKEKMFVTATELKVRENPSNTSKVIASIPQAKNIVILEKSKKVIKVDGKEGSWFKVKTKDNINGWVFSAYLSSDKKIIKKYTNCNKQNKIVYKDKCIKKKIYECTSKDKIILDGFCISKKMKKYLSGKAYSYSTCQTMGEMIYLSNKTCIAGNNAYGKNYGKWKLENKDGMTAAKCSLNNSSVMGSNVHFLIDTKQGLKQIRKGKLMPTFPLQASGCP